jgi:hypothetical protein
MVMKGQKYEKVSIEQMEKEIPIENIKLNDFFKLGRYTYIIALLLYLMMLNMIGTALFMMFAGKNVKIERGK